MDIPASLYGMTTKRGEHNHSSSPTGENRATPVMSKRGDSIQGPVAFYVISSSDCPPKSGLKNGFIGNRVGRKQNVGEKVGHMLVDAWREDSCR